MHTKHIGNGRKFISSVCEIGAVAGHSTLPQPRHRRHQNIRIESVPSRLIIRHHVSSVLHPRYLREAVQASLLEYVADVVFGCVAGRHPLQHTSLSH